MKNRRIPFLLVTAICMSLAFSLITHRQTNGGLAMQLTSAVFQQEEAIPAKYTCDGQDISPPLNWSGEPEGTESFALICDDPDAPNGLWVHWVIYNIPATVHSLIEGTPKQEALPDGSLQGSNSWPKTGYGGPCPPSGTHRYFFKLYALDALLDMGPGATHKELLQAMEGHILAKAQLMGTYSRK